MIYIATIAAIALLVFSQVIYRRAMKGAKVSIQLEKTIFLITAVTCIIAIVELCEFVSSLYTHDGDEFSGWLPAILGYPLGFLLFIFIVFVVMPPPIPRDHSKEIDD